MGRINHDFLLMLGLGPWLKMGLTSGTSGSDRLPNLQLLRRFS